ncbi:MAG TPA: hypothetical protein VKV79_04005 [Terriglobia bacterium]|nr:hypothetical protein [Terriglobia bacterium]
MARDSQTRKQIILDYCAEKQLKKAGAAEIRAIEERLAQSSGAAKRSSSYIVQVLRDAGVKVEYSDRYGDAPMPEPYASSLKGKLKFHDLAEAESSIRELDSAFRAYERAGDRTGAAFVRSILLKGRLRAEGLAGSARVQPQKRREKAEIARWFAVWLQTPELFFDWLELRKRSTEFLCEFGAAQSAGVDDSPPGQG